MISPLDIWALTLRAPFSGDVTQTIEPRVLSPEIKGSAAIEEKVITEVASYGTQLGKILRALETLSKETKVDLPEIAKLIQEVEAVKKDTREGLRAEAEDALRRLKKADETGWKEVMRAE